MSVSIYHNPRCSKSRQALGILNERSIGMDVVEYLKDPPTENQLKDLIRKLGIRPLELVRKGESVFKEKYKGRYLTDKEWIVAMSEHPILIERPIVIRGDRAVIGRPPVKILEILDGKDTE